MTQSHKELKEELKHSKKVPWNGSNVEKLCSDVDGSCELEEDKRINNCISTRGKVHEEDTNAQRQLWRQRSYFRISTFVLQTLSYAIPLDICEDSALNGMYCSLAILLWKYIKHSSSTLKLYHGFYRWILLS